jgi:hypothetical protein
MSHALRKSSHQFEWCPKCSVFQDCYFDEHGPHALDPECSYGPLEAIDAEPPEECIACRHLQTVANYPMGPEFGMESMYDDCSKPDEEVCPHGFR